MNVDDYVEKPIALEELLHRVEARLKGRGRGLSGGEACFQGSCLTRAELNAADAVLASTCGIGVQAAAVLAE